MKASLVTALTYNFRVKSRVTQDHHVDAIGDWKLIDDLCSQLRLRAMLFLLTLGVLARVIGQADGNPQAARCDQEAEYETVTALGSVLVLAEAAILFRASFSIASAVRVLSGSALKSHHRGVDDEQVFSLPILVAEQLANGRAEQIGDRLTIPLQESRCLSTVQWFLDERTCRVHAGVSAVPDQN